MRGRVSVGMLCRRAKTLARALRSIDKSGDWDVGRSRIALEQGEILAHGLLAFLGMAE